MLGMTKISSLDGCSGMSDMFEECLADGQCPFCEEYADGLPTNSTGSELTIDNLHETEQFTCNNDTVKGNNNQQLQMIYGGHVCEEG